MRFKSTTLASTRLRLVELTSAFEEQGYCSSAHFGMVLEGALIVAYEGGALLYRAGDGLLIPAGTEARHRASVEEGGRALLILVEPSLSET